MLSTVQASKSRRWTFLWIRAARSEQTDTNLLLISSINGTLDCKASWKVRGRWTDRSAKTNIPLRGAGAVRRAKGSIGGRCYLTCEGITVVVPLQAFLGKGIELAGCGR